MLQIVLLEPAVMKMKFTHLSKHRPMGLEERSKIVSISKNNIVLNNLKPMHMEFL